METLSSENDSILEKIGESSKIARNIYFFLISLIVYAFLIVIGTTDKDLLLIKSANLPFLDINIPINLFYFITPVILLIIYINMSYHISEIVIDYKSINADKDRAKIYPWEINSNVLKRKHRHFFDAVQRILNGFSLYLMLPITLFILSFFYLKLHEPVLSYVIILFPFCSIFMSLRLYLVINGISLQQWMVPLKNTVWILMLLTVLNLLFTVFSLLFPLLVYVIFIQTLLYRPIIIAIDIVLLVLFFVVLKNKISERLKFILFALNISLCSLAFFAIGREVNEFTDSLIHLGYLTLISLSFILYLKIKNQISNRELKVFSLTFIVLIAANFLFSLNYASLNTLETIGGLNLDVSYENVSSDGSVPNTIDNRNLQNINFNNTLMINTHAKSANLSNADFSYSNFSFSDFTASNLSSANFNNATLLNCKFSEADLSGTTFNGANLKGAVFKSRENVVGVRIENVKFWGADLTKADFYGVQFENVDFSNAVLDSADFQQTDLTQTRSLTIDQLLKVKTLHHAMIDSTLGKRIFNINPELFISKEDIGDYTINDFKKDIIANYQPSQKIPDWVLINMVSGSLYGTDFEWISKLYINYYINSLIKEGFLKKADSTNYIRRK